MPSHYHTPLMIEYWRIVVCVEALFTETESISLSRRGQLFGSPIFEYEVISPTTHPNRLLLDVQVFDAIRG